MRRFSWMIVMLLICAFLSPASSFSQDQTRASLLKEARAMIYAGDTKTAVAKLQPLDNSEDIYVTQLLGLAHYSASDYPHAIEKFAAVVDKLPNDSMEWRETIQLLGLSHYVLGHLEKSFPYLEKAVTWSSGNNELIYALGMAAIQTRRPEKARESFARMFHVDPDSAAAHLLTAQMMVRVEFEEFAETELKKALEKDPKMPQANYLLGQIAIYKSKFDEGIALMERELAVNPGNANAFYKIGDAYTRQIKWDDAIIALQKSVWLYPFYSGPYILLGKSYMKKRQLASAEGMLKRAIQFDPNNKSAHYMLGQVYQQSNRPEDAKREFAIAEKLHGSTDQPEK